METSPSIVSRERLVRTLPGWLVLPFTILLPLAGIGLFLHGADAHAPVILGLGVACASCAVLSLFGYFTLQPNQARVLVLFGAYRGTVKEGGFHWANPFYSNGGSGGFGPRISPKGEISLDSGPKRNPRMKISLRARNLNGERLKVNDIDGNPIDKKVGTN